MRYKCSICGYIYDEEKEGRPFTELTECPICKQPPEKFVLLDSGTANRNESTFAGGNLITESSDKDASEESAASRVPENVVPKDELIGSDENKTDCGGACTAISLEYPANTRKTDSDYRYMKEIHEMAVTGKSIIEAMGTRMPMPSWDDIMILGAQLNPAPLDEHAPVSTMTVMAKMQSGR